MEVFIVPPTLSYIPVELYQNLVQSK